MVDVRCLRQAGRAARIDVEAPVLDRKRRELAGRNRRVGQRVDPGIKALVAFRCSAVAPELRSRDEVRLGGAEPFDQRRIDDDVLRGNDVDAMRQRRAAEICIEQGDDPAGARDAEPDREIFRPVRHHQRHHVALGDAMRHRPAGVLVGAPVELPIGERLALGDEGGLVAIGAGELARDLREGAVRRLCDLGHLRDGAEHAGQVGKVAPDSLDQAHSHPCRRPPNLRANIADSPGRRKASIVVMVARAFRSPCEGIITLAEHG